MSFTRSRGRIWVSSVASEMNLGAWINRIFKKKRAKIGLYGPPNAGKTTLANRICEGLERGRVPLETVSPIPHETRRAMRKEGVMINANGSTIELDIVDTPGHGDED